MILWREDFTTSTGLQGMFTPKCKHDGTVGDFFMAKVGQIPRPDGINPYHINIEMRCPECGYWWVYEIMIPKKHYDWFSTGFKKVFNE